MKWAFLIFALVMNAGASVVLKVGSKIAENSPLADDASFLEKVCHFLNVPTVIAICMFAVNVLAYRRALNELNISVAYPIMVSGGLVLVTTLACFIPLLEERIAWWQIVGMLLIAGGVWLVALRPSSL
jgi:multidrug transporter EmrE-like cation transporter